MGVVICVAENLVLLGLDYTDSIKERLLRLNDCAQREKVDSRSAAVLLKQRTAPRVYS